ITDLAGVPLALLMAGYTGVLLGGSSTPVWSKNPWLGPLFSASAVSTGAAAIGLALAARHGLGSFPTPEPPASAALETVNLAAHVAEALTLAGYLSAAGELARPLTQGGMARPFWGALLGLAAGEVVRHLPGGR